jgi:glycosyltransferase involved in cell wall biosynthesis
VKIVAFAYACEPGKGSEPGAGWSLAQMLATFADVHVITRSNNRAAIEEGLASVSGRVPSFSYVEAPAWAQRLKRGNRGIRIYHSLWQLAALREARRLHKKDPFDVAWHLTIANVWLGSAAGRLEIPFVFGPVGGGVAAPWKLVRDLGGRAIAFEVARRITRRAWLTLNPLARSALRSARLIIVQNKETKDWLPRRYGDKTAVFPNAVMERAIPAGDRAPGASPAACFAGRLVGWKGAELAVRAVSAHDDWSLIVLGDGSDSGRLNKIIAEVGVADRVDIRGRVDHERLFETLTHEVDVFLFPSLHDDGPLAVAEALACGLPVVCLDIGGPPAIAGDRAIAVDPQGSMEQVVERLAAALPSALAMGRATGAGSSFTIAARAQALQSLVSYPLRDVL